MKHFSKVAAFVVANDNRLLVFDHPLAGTQLPAGSVEEGESFVEAARREVFEETGIQVTDGEIVGTTTENLNGHGVLLCDVINAERQTIARGHKVLIIGRSSDSIVIREDIYDYSVTPAKLKQQTQIKTDIENIAFVIERTFVRFTTNSVMTTARWSHEADGNILEPYWTDLGDPVELIGPQNNWLEFIR